MRPVSTSENRGSDLLHQDENDQVFRLVGNRCQTLATAVVQLFLTDAPDHSAWRRKDAGVLCLVKDNQRRSYFFRLFCLARRQLVWEHEVYNSMDYKSPRPFFHTFEAEECIVAFNFADEKEATKLRDILFQKQEAKKRRSERRSRASLQSQFSFNQGQAPVQVPPPGATTIVNGSFTPVPSPKQQHHAPASRSGRRKDRDAKRRLTKADIGLPQDFRHVSHVGWDPNKGFDVDNVEDPQLTEFFAKAGVSDSQLQDRETREFIYDFIKHHGGLDAVKEEVKGPPPPVPIRTAPVSQLTQIRSAPPPPARTGALPPPPSQPLSAPPPPPPLKTLPHRQPQPLPPQPQGMPAPPPPPPPPPMPPAETTSIMPPPPPPGPTVAAADPRSALLESIRTGKPLKHVEVDANTKKQASLTSDSRSDLLDQIRQGVELKSVQSSPASPASTIINQDGLAGALARALAERSRAIHSDTSDSSDDDEDDDEWED